MASTASSSSPYLSTFCPSSSPKPRLPAKPPHAASLSSHQRAARGQARTAPSLPPLARPSGSSDRRSLFSRRRGIMSTSTLLFLLQLPEFLDGSSFPALAAQLNADGSTTIKEEIRKVVSKGKAAGVLRLVFHDAGTFDIADNSGGMNGSIVLELDRPENAGLKKPLKVLEKARAELDAQLQVSWADMIALAGAEAVSICGGPSITVTLGRVDSLDPDPPGRLPEESLDAAALKLCFQKKGFSTQELVALSGAHTLGSKGFGSPNVFDNSYYKILLEKPWVSAAAAGMTSMIGLPSDRGLVEDAECLRWIEAYANDQDLFFKDFKNAYTKMVNLGARWRW